MQEPHVEGNAWLKEVFFEKYDAKALWEMQVLMRENERKMSEGLIPKHAYAPLTYPIANNNHNNGPNRNNRRNNNNNHGQQSQGRYGGRDAKFPSMNERKEWERRLTEAVKNEMRQALNVRDLCMGFHMPGFNCQHIEIMNGAMCQDRRRPSIIRKHTCVCGAAIACDHCKNALIVN